MIILKKKRYHHTTVLIYCWYSASEFAASGRWFVLMNLTVHGFMYSYYCMRALRFKIPKWVNIAITSGQISQMVFGIYVNCQAYLKKQRGESCEISDENIKWSFLMYFSYFLLFFHFFYKTYIATPSISNNSNNSKRSTAPVNAKSNGTNGHHENVFTKYISHDQNNNSKNHYD